MNIFAKIYSLLAMAFTVSLIGGIILYPGARRFDVLIPACSIGFALNIGLMFIVLRDIFLRHFPDRSTKYVWLAMTLIVWPSILVYLLRHGFKPLISPSGCGTAVGGIEGK